MFVRVIAALVAGLLAVSCRGAEPEPQPEPQVRALEPVEEIGTVIQPDCATYGACTVPFSLWSDETESLIAEVRLDQPSWLRYVRAIELWNVGGGTIEEGPLPQARVETGIFLNETGREVGRTICESMLEREVADRVLVWGVVDSPSWMTSDTVRKSLATCRALR
jgi:hypothetical protein